MEPPELLAYRERPKGPAVKEDELPGLDEDRKERWGVEVEELRVRGDFG